MSNLQTYYLFKLDFQQWTKWLIHGTKSRKDNQLRSLETPRYDILVGNVNMT